MERITFENYRDYDAINYSKLKSLDDHPSKLLEERDWGDGLEFGDALDLLVFTPELFDEQYYVADLDNLPSDNVKNIIEDVVDRHGEEITDETVLAAAQRADYGQSWNDSTILRKILEDYNGARYAQMLVNAKDKRVLSIDRHMEIIQAVETLKTHPWTKSWLFDEVPETWSRYTQLPLVTSGAPKHKCLLDLVLVNHEEKLIHPIDLKNTGRPVHRFASQFISYSYYLQAGLYTNVLQMLIEEAESGTDVQEFTGLDFDPSGYGVAPFLFIVISSKDRLNPIRYRCSDVDIHVGIHGGKLTNGRQVKGFRELTKEYLWHKENDAWDYPYEAYQNEGEMKLDVFKSPLDEPNFL